MDPADIKSSRVDSHSFSCRNCGRRGARLCRLNPSTDVPHEFCANRFGVRRHMMWTLLIRSLKRDETAMPGFEIRAKVSAEDASSR